MHILSQWMKQKENQDSNSSLNIDPHGNSLYLPNKSMKLELGDLSSGACSDDEFDQVLQQNLIKQTTKNDEKKNPSNKIEVKRKTSVSNHRFQANACEEGSRGRD
jgi:hypothetical protein